MTNLHWQHLREICYFLDQIDIVLRRFLVHSFSDRIASVHSEWGSPRM